MNILSLNSTGSLDLCDGFVFSVVVNKELLFVEGTGGCFFCTRPDERSCNERLGLTILKHSTDDHHCVDCFDRYWDIFD